MRWSVPTTALRLLLVFTAASLLAACTPASLIPPRGAPGNTEAILILPGLGMTKAGLRDMSTFSHVADSAGFEVYVFDYRSRRSVERGVDRLIQLMDENDLDRYQRVHVFAYILGGYTLNLALEEALVPNLGHVVYDRSPLQEMAPKLGSTGAFGLLAWLAVGPILADLAGTEYTPLERARQRPADGESGRRIGIIMENRATRFIRKRKDRALAMRPLTFDPDALGQAYDDVLHVPLNHDEMYRAFDIIGPELLHFFRFGAFSTEASRVPLNIDPFQR
ncbi:MAG: hypothetical protein HKN29_13730 [Rhodothermales bacterium]|nr:hypothetical protein [Rhodothermales bacterium]